MAAKLLVTPLAMLLASLASRRWGDAIGGWLVGLPVVSGPVSVFLALERGPEFASAAAAGSVSGVIAQSCFCIGYGAFAARGLQAALAVASLAYGAGGAVAIELAPPLFALMAAAAAMLVVVRARLPAHPNARESAPKPPRWDIPARMATVTALVMIVTALAGALGPRVCGLAASFPVIGGGLAVFAHFGRGPAAGVAALRGMASALIGFIIFFGVIASACRTSNRSPPMRWRRPPR